MPSDVSKWLNRLPVQTEIDPQLKQGHMPHHVNLVIYGFDYYVWVSEKNSG